MATKINVRSPFYYRIPYSPPSSLPPANGGDTVIQVYIYTGLSTAIPASPQYILRSPVIQYENGGANYYSSFELSEVIRDYIECNFSGVYSPSNYPAACVWVAISKDSGSTFTTYIATDGYGYFNEGVNPELSRSLMISNTTIWRPIGETIRVPVFGNDQINVTYFDNGNFISQQTTTASTNTNSIIKNFSVPALADSFIVVNSTAGESTTVYVRDMNCGMYDAIKITFINKFGGLQDVYFFAKNTESISVTSNNYKPNIFNAEAGTYNVAEHHNKVLNMNGTDSIKLNTGFVSEDYNEVLKQMMLSEKVWMTKDSVVYTVTPRTNSLEYMTSLNDKMVSYTIDFDYASDAIQNVR